MNNNLAYRTDDAPAPELDMLGETPRQQLSDILGEVTTAAASYRAAQHIAVEIADAAQLADMRAAWTELLSRADALNVFMDPALQRVAASIDPAGEHRTLLAWKSFGGLRQLVGVWAFAPGRAQRSPLPVRVLNAPPCVHGFLATPVIDRCHLDDTLDAMLDCIAADPRLPKIVAFDAIGTDAPTYDALLRVLADRDSEPCIFDQWLRPKLSSELDGKTYLDKSLSGLTRKRLRQRRRGLSDQGALNFTIAAAPDAVRGALEEFMAMEASGWKDRKGTALLSDKSDAAFMRGVVGALADAGRASIHSLYLDGKPVSMQIVVRAGAAAFVWKTTYDEAYQDYSPGTLLLEDSTTAFLADKSIAFVDSCSHDDSGFMSAWSERQPVADLWIDARRGGSLAFRVLCGAQIGYRQMRGTAKQRHHAEVNAVTSGW